MSKCTQSIAPFPRVKKRAVDVRFGATTVSSDAGALLLGQIDRRLGLSESAAKALGDKRRQRSCDHSVRDLLRQRVYAIGLGYEDLNDHAHLKSDLILQTAAGTEAALASPATLCRFENRATRDDCVALSKVLIETFVKSFRKAPKDLILDFDSTDDRVHGEQTGAIFNAHYGDYCFLPLYVFCGKKLLTAYLRPGTDVGPRHAWAILALLVRRFRQEWPGVKILFRADSAFNSSQILQWCDRESVDYVVAMRGWTPLKEMVETQRALFFVENSYEANEKTVTRYDSFHYRAHRHGARHLWPENGRRIVLKAKHDGMSPTVRFVVTSLTGESAKIFEEFYDPRGEMENRLKEQKLSLFSDRTSCQGWWANQLRVLLSAMAYVLLEGLRSLALKGTELATAQCGTIRLKLLKIGAVVERNSRRVRILVSKSYPMPGLLERVARELCPS